jgi:hypothetical protein
MEFEIIKVEQIKQRLLIEVELTDRSRRQFGYPIGEGWENKIDGEFKFDRDIDEKLNREERISKQNIDISEINKSITGKKIKLKK